MIYVYGKQRLIFFKKTRVNLTKSKYSTAYECSKNLDLENVKDYECFIQLT